MKKYCNEIYCFSPVYLFFTSGNHKSSQFSFLTLHKFDSVSPFCTIIEFFSKLASGLIHCVPTVQAAHCLCLSPRVVTSDSFCDQRMWWRPTSVSDCVCSFPALGNAPNTSDKLVTQRLSSYSKNCAHCGQWAEWEQGSTSITLNIICTYFRYTRFTKKVFLCFFRFSYLNFCLFTTDIFLTVPHCSIDLFWVLWSILERPWHFSFHIPLWQSQKSAKTSVRVGFQHPEQL